MPTRTSSARWQGTLKDGSGTVSLGSGAYEGAYSFVSRFEDGTGTNPEELIAAALAGCYSMALSAALDREGHAPRSVDTSAAVHLEKNDSGLAISRIDLTTRGDVPGIDAAEFEKHAEATRTGCIVSRALGAVEITLNATLV
jgi:osmotically inducible protein OsmC